MLAASLIVQPNQVVQLGLPGVTTNYAYSSLIVDYGGTLKLAGTVTLNISSNVVVNGNILGGLGGTAQDGVPGVDGTNGVYSDTEGYAENGGDGTDGGKGASGGSAPWVTINAQDMSVDGAIRLNPSLDGGGGGAGGAGGNGADGDAFGIYPDSPDGGSGGTAGIGGDGGDAGSEPSLTINLFGVGVYNPNGKFTLGSNGVISLDNLATGGGGGAGGDGGDGGLGGSTAGPIGPGGSGPGGAGGLAGDGGNGGAGGDAGYLEIDAAVIDLEGRISLRGGDGGNGGDVGRPGNGGDGGLYDYGGNAGDWYPCSLNTNLPCSFAGSGGSGGSGGVLLLSTATSFTDHVTTDFSGGVGGDGGIGQPTGAGVGGKGGGGPPPGASGPPGTNGLPSLAIPDGSPGTVGVDGYMELDSTGGTFLGGTLGAWQMSGAGRLDFVQNPSTGARSIKLSAQNIRFYATTLATDPRLQYNSSSGRSIFEGDEPLQLHITYQWFSTNGSVNLQLGGQTVLHLVAPSVLPGGLTQVDLTLTDRPQPNAQGYLNLEFQLVGPARIEFADFSLQALPLLPLLSVRLSPTNSTALNLQWFGTTNQDYQVQYRTSLNTGGWTNFGPVIIGSGGASLLQLPVVPGQPRRFYRVVMTPAN